MWFKLARVTTRLSKYQAVVWFFFFPGVVRFLFFFSLLFLFFLFFNDPPGDLCWVFWGKLIFLYLPFVIWVFGFSPFFWCLPLGFPFACVIY